MVAVTTALCLLIGALTTGQVTLTPGSARSNSNSAALPTGAIVLLLSGECPTGYSEETALDGRTIIGTLSSRSDAGDTGGSNSVTPTFTGSAATLTHSGTAVADHASHTHAYTDVLNHTHVINVTDGGHNHTQNAHTHTQASTTTSTGSTSNRLGTADTSSTAQDTGSATATNNSAVTGITASSVNPSGGVAAGTTSGPSAALTHSVTPPNDHGYTPAGAISAVDTRSAYTKVIFCAKT